MNLWLDIGGVVKQDIEHVVAFVESVRRSGVKPP
jgi:hypothetical protein